MTKVPRATSISIALVLLIGVVTIAGFLASPVVCPYCHNSDSNVKGACVLRQSKGHCPEDYYPEHFNRSSCPWCKETGRMPRLAALTD